MKSKILAVLVVMILALAMAPTVAHAMQMFVKKQTGESKISTLEVETTDTVAQVKQIMQSKEGIAPELQLLVYKGEKLEDAKTLADCGINVKDQTLYLIVSGETANCGDEGDGSNLKWSFNIDTDVLTISGTGTMGDYAPQGAPWYPFRNLISTVVIDDNVVSIGSSAFYDCAALTSVSIPDSLISIGSGTFSGCTALTSVDIPGNVNDIFENAFNGCSKLSSVTFAGQSPPGIIPSAFDNLAASGTVYYPEGAATAYSNILTSMALNNSNWKSGAKVSGVIMTMPQPTAGATASALQASVTTTGVTLDEGVWMQWDANTDDYVLLPADTVFEEGEAYYYSIVLRADEGYAFPENGAEITISFAKLNGENALSDIPHASALSFLYRFDIPVTYTVSYSANGGSGTMPSVTATAGQAIALPSCAFTAPAGKEFKAWSINGTQYAADATYTVSANTTVTAMWQDTSASTPTPTPTDPDPTPTPIDPDPTPTPTPSDPDPTPAPTPTPSDPDPAPTPSPIDPDPAPAPMPTPTDPDPTPSEPVVTPTPDDPDSTPTPIDPPDSTDSTMPHTGDRSYAIMLIVILVISALALIGAAAWQKNVKL